MNLPPLPDIVLEPIVRLALAEDLGQAGDVTSDICIPRNEESKAKLVAREAGRIAGLDAAALALRLIDPSAKMTVYIADGSDAPRGATVATLEGASRTLLTAERTMLNFIGHLSGIATLSAQFAKAIEGTQAHIVCTRKTTPGLRALEKRAVRLGGALNHRFNLADAILIKDNHIVAAGGIGPALTRARAAVGHLMAIEIEVDNLGQLAEALPYNPTAILLDNMNDAELRQAVAMVAKHDHGRCYTEASGGVTLDTVRAIAETGVNYISAGAITHSARRMDVALDFE
ncbi:MAG: carboxylating nicotinate-nucleotide diphosphorylase [Caulobacterales bacterium]